MKEIVFLGDSIANGFYDGTGLGWPSRLIMKLNEKSSHGFYYNNLAVSGDRIFDVWHRLCAFAIPRKPDALFIAVGVNDCIRWNSPEQPMDISYDMRNEFWRLVLDKAKNNIKQVFVVGLIPVVESRMPEEGAFNKKFYNMNADIEEYNKFISDLCKEFSLPFFDVYPQFESKKMEELIYDASHPNSKGHELIADFCLEELENLNAI